MTPSPSLEHLYPSEPDRQFGLGLLHEAILAAHAQNPATWSVTLTPSYVRLNTGRAETFALYADSIHFVCDRLVLPKARRPRSAEDVYEGIPNSTYLDIPVAEAKIAIADLRPAWHAAIASGAMSARAAIYRRYHSDALIAYLRSVFPDTPNPAWVGSEKPAINSAAFTTLYDHFLERAHDFGHFTDRVGAYWTEERAYKLDLGELCWERLAAPQFEGADTDAGADRVVAETLKVLRHRLPSIKAPQNLASWRYYDFLRSLTNAGKRTFALAFRDLLHGSGPSPMRLADYTRKTWGLMKRASGGNPYAQARMFPTLFLMSMYPRSDIAVRTDLFQAASRELMGHPILEAKPIDGEQYEAILSFCASVRDQLELRGMPPADMIDIHSFLWMATRQAAAESE